MLAFAGHSATLARRRLLGGGAVNLATKTREPALRIRTMEDSTWLRFFSILALYAGQGITQGLVIFVIPAWMAANGVETAEIALAVGTMTAPWSIKFLVGLVIDRFTYLPMGRRKAWILVAQLVAVAGLLMLAFLDPAPSQIMLVTVFMTITNGAVAMQDVAIDALTVDIFPEEQRELAGGIAGGGQFLGVAAISALGGIAFAEGGASAAFSLSALLLFCVLLNLLVVRERQGERLLPWTAGQASPINAGQLNVSILAVVKSIFRTTFSRVSLSYLPVLFLRGLSYGTFVILMPIVATQYVGWSEAELGALNGTAQLAAAILCISVGGYLASRIGAQRWLLLLYLLLVAVWTWLLLEQGAWDQELTLYVVVIATLILFTFTVIGMTVINMRLCPPQAAASQFALYAGINNIGVSGAGFIIGSFALLAEPANMLGLMIGALSLGALVLFFAKYPTVQMAR